MWPFRAKKLRTVFQRVLCPECGEPAEHVAFVGEYRHPEEPYETHEYQCPRCGCSFRKSFDLD